MYCNVFKLPHCYQIYCINTALPPNICVRNVEVLSVLRMGYCRGVERSAALSVGQIFTRTSKQAINFGMEETCPITSTLLQDLQKFKRKSGNIS